MTTGREEKARKIVEDKRVMATDKEGGYWDRGKVLALRKIRMEFSKPETLEEASL